MRLWTGERGTGMRTLADRPRKLREFRTVSTALTDMHGILIDHHYDQ